MKIYESLSEFHRNHPIKLTKLYGVPNNLDAEEAFYFVKATEYNIPFDLATLWTTKTDLCEDEEYIADAVDCYESLLEEARNYSVLGADEIPQTYNPKLLKSQTQEAKEKAYDDCYEERKQLRNWFFATR